MQFIDIIMKLIKFEWLKDYRTASIVVIVIAGFVVETFLKIDIPGVQFTIENVLLALGLSTAAAHDPA